MQAITDSIMMNMHAQYLRFGAVEGGSWSDGPDIKWVRTGGTVMNHAFSRAIAPGETEDSVARVTEMVRSWQVPGAWQLEENAASPGLVECAVRHGWKAFPGCEGMAAALDGPIPEAPTPEGLTISEVADEESLRLWVGIFFRGADDQRRKAYADVFCELGHRDGLPWRYYLGFLRGEPVASSMLFTGAGTVGLYFVGTIPDARRQGIGTAMTRHSMVQAREMGYSQIVLQATGMGAPVYRRLRFKSYCRIGILALLP